MHEPPLFSRLLCEVYCQRFNLDASCEPLSKRKAPVAWLAWGGVRYFHEMLKVFAICSGNSVLWWAQ